MIESPRAYLRGDFFALGLGFYFGLLRPGGSGNPRYSVRGLCSGGSHTELTRIVLIVLNTNDTKVSKLGVLSVLSKAGV